MKKLLLSLLVGPSFLCGLFSFWKENPFMHIVGISREKIHTCTRGDNLSRLFGQDQTHVACSCHTLNPATHTTINNNLGLVDSPTSKQLTNILLILMFSLYIQRQHFLYLPNASSEWKEGMTTRFRLITPTLAIA